MANYATFKMKDIGIMPLRCYIRKDSEWFEEEAARMFIEKGIMTEIPYEYFTVEFNIELFESVFTEAFDVDVFDHLMTDEDLKRVESIRGTWEVDHGALVLTEVKVEAVGNDTTWIRDWTEEWMRTHEDELTVAVSTQIYNILIDKTDEYAEPLFEVYLRSDIDYRWMALYHPGRFDATEYSNLVYNGEITLKDLIKRTSHETIDHELWRDEVIRRAANLPEGRVWRNHSKVNEALAFTLYAIDNQWDYDQLMQRIGMNADQYTAERNLFVEGLESATPQQTTTNSNTNSNTTTIMEQTNNKPQDWKMAPATPTTDLEQTYGSKFEAAFSIVLDPESNTTLGDMPRTWSYRGGKNNVIVCTVTDIAELTYEVQFGKRTQYVVHNDQKYVFASVPNMKKALEECFDEEGNATADIWQYCQNKPKTEKADAPKTAAPKTAPKAETKTKKKEVVEQPKQTEQPTAPMVATLTPTPSATADVDCYEDNERWYYFYNNFCSGTVIQKDDCHIVNNYPKADPDYMRRVVTACNLTHLDKTPEAVITALVKANIISAPMAVVAAPVEEPKPAPKAEAPKSAEPKTIEQPKAAEPKAEEHKVVSFTLPNTIVAGDLKDGRMTITGLTDLTAEQVQIFIAGMNAMKEAIRKQMKMTGTDANDLPF